MSTFPTLPSAILTTALEDLAAVQAMPGMTINMGIWLAFDEEKSRPCEACLAGAVMLRQFSQLALAGREKSKQTESILFVTPAMMSLPAVVKMAMYMLNDFAQGEFSLGLDGYLCGGLNRSWINPQQQVAVRDLENRFTSAELEYEDDPSAWTAFMLEARNVLAEIGL